jgi:hypothetical protein
LVLSLLYHQTIIIIHSIFFSFYLFCLKRVNFNAVSSCMTYYSTAKHHKIGNSTTIVLMSPIPWYFPQTYTNLSQHCFLSNFKNSRLCHLFNQISRTLWSLLPPVITRKFSPITFLEETHKLPTVNYVSVEFQLYPRRLMQQLNFDFLLQEPPLPITHGGMSSQFPASCRHQLSCATFVTKMARLTLLFWMKPSPAGHSYSRECSITPHMSNLHSICLFPRQPCISSN